MPCNNDTIIFLQFLDSRIILGVTIPVVVGVLVAILTGTLLVKCITVAILCMYIYADHHHNKALLVVPLFPFVIANMTTILSRGHIICPYHAHLILYNGKVQEVQFPQLIDKLQ